jgi:hypothetical protein
MDSPVPPYVLRANAFVARRTYRLTDDALTWEEDGKPLDGVFLDQIAAVRLAYAPTRAATRRFRTRVILKAGGMVELCNLSYRGFADFEDQSAAYVTFVTELHRRLAEKGRDVHYHAGNTPAGYVGNLLVTIVPFAALAAVLLLLPLTAVPAIAIVKLIIIAAFIPALVRYLRRARPTTYTPDAIPPGMLP